MVCLYAQLFTKLDDDQYELQLFQLFSCECTFLVKCMCLFLCLFLMLLSNKANFLISTKIKLIRFGLFVVYVSVVALIFRRQKISILCAAYLLVLFCSFVSFSSYCFYLLYNSYLHQIESNFKYGALQGYVLMYKLWSKSSIEFQISNLVPFPPAVVNKNVC